MQGKMLFVVNILSSHQQPVSDLCTAGSLVGIDSVWATGQLKPAFPTPTDASSSIFFVKTDMISYGSHQIRAAHSTALRLQC
jgi:hypothetical protein